MAEAEQLSAEVRQEIANQIGERIAPRIRLAPGAAGPALGESLKVLMLPLDQVQNGKGPLAVRVRETGQWHHQVYAGDAPAYFARSQAAGDEPSAGQRVVEVAESDLPQAVQASIAWVDANMPEPATAELLVAPDYFLTALWLHGDGTDAVVIASRADGLSDLEINTRIESDEFLRRLAAHAPVAGLGSELRTGEQS